MVELPQGILELCSVVHRGIWREHILLRRDWKLVGFQLKTTHETLHMLRTEEAKIVI